MTQFKIANFRQFSKPVTVPLQPITVLIGANNSGKTTILQALNIFQYCIESCLDKTNGNGSKGHLTLKGRNLGPEDFGRLPVATPLDLWPQGRPSGAIKLTASFDDGSELTFDISLTYNLFKIHPVLKCADEDAFLRTFRIQFVPIFSGLLPQEEFLPLPSRNDRARSQRHGEIVRNLLVALKNEEPKRWKRLLDALHRLYPNANLDVSYDGELATSAKIDTSYDDDILKKGRDVIVSGSGFHQATQIFAGVLQPHVSMILLDEPDSHLHARLQSELMSIFSDLATEENLQFVIATHSPHLLRAAPVGSIHVCRNGTVTLLSKSATEIDLLDRLGAFDRMELVPLLQSGKVCFVENADDRKRLTAFARKLWGDKTDMLLRPISFLHTYQEPVSAGVTQLARQVKDILHAAEKEASIPGRTLAMIIVGDRDYRSDEQVRAATRDVAKKAEGYTATLCLWRRNEIENYLLDLPAITAAVTDRATAAKILTEWRPLITKFEAYFAERVAAQRDRITQIVAGKIQNENPRLEIITAMDRARTQLDSQWGDGTAWVDAKVLLSELRTWLQHHKIPCNLGPNEIIAHMKTVPMDVQKVLRKLRSLGAPKKKMKAKPKASKTA